MGMQKFLFQIWRFQYWASMILGFIVFPLMGEYIVSGAFNKCRRIRAGLISNALFYVIVSAPGILFLILILFFNLNKDLDVFQFILMINNTVSLICIIMFMSYGVVAIPKKYLNKKSLKERLDNAYYGVYQMENKIQERVFDVEECMSNLHKMAEAVRKGTCTLENADSYCKIIARQVPPSMIRKSKNLTGDLLEEKYEKCDLNAFELIHYEIKMQTNNY
jgi:hypothetical protein